MAQEPIYGDNGQIVDYFDDGEPAKQEQEQSEQPPPGASAEESQTEVSENATCAWKVPDILQGTDDLFIGLTIHHNDGDLQGPLVSVFVREVPDGPITVKAYRAAELSSRTFLDNVQKAIAATMQKHLLSWAERQRKKLEEEAKRKSRQTVAQASPPVPAPSSPAVSSPAKETTSTKTSPGATARPSSPPPTSKSSKPAKESKYVTASMFD